MQFLTSVGMIFVFVGLIQADEANDSWQILGQVVNEYGAPVENFEASTFWSSFGDLWDKEGRLLEKEAIAEHARKNEGVLAASPDGLARRLPEGRFVALVDGLTKVSLFVVDSRRERGGIALVEKNGAEQSVSITMAPLVRVTAEVYCSALGKTPDWAGVRVFPVGPKGPHQSVMTCNSLRGKASFLLPAGKYDFAVRTKGPGARLPVPDGQAGVRVEIPDRTTVVDVGVIDVPLQRGRDGVVRHYSRSYGKVPPPLAITDARGVPREVQLADYRGKWVLLDFWALWCQPCIGGSLPKLAKFYEEHPAAAEQFEVLAVCNTAKEKALTIEAFDALVAPIVEKVWDGKALPFPVLVDGEGATAANYGIIGWPTTLLVDPEGKLVKLGAYDTSIDYLAEQLDTK